MPQLLRELEAAFLDDHDRLTRGLELIARSLEAGDLRVAVAAAEALDVSIGPYVRFEEEELYPLLRRRLGKSSVEALRAEHRDGREALGSLLAVSRRGSLTPEEREELSRAVRRVLDRALSCSGLFRRVSSCEPEEQRHLLDRLRELRREPARWSGPGGRGTDVG